MNVASRTMSGPNFIVCPACGRGKLEARGHDSAECSSCGRGVEGAILRALEQIVALPDALGEHACECGHPEMRRLPDGVFHCPACGSEVLPVVGASLEPEGSGAASEAYRRGRADRLFGSTESFVHDHELRG